MLLQGKKLFPVVITEHEINLLNDDNQKKQLILSRIEQLSTKYHKVEFKLTKE